MDAPLRAESAARVKPSLASMKTLQVSTAEYYNQYSARKGVDRNNLLRNPEVLFQIFARDAALIRGLRWIDPDPESARVLDVGCGYGDSLWPFLRLGFEPSNLFGVDIQEDRIRKARMTNPLVNFECVDATSLDFPDETFDIAMETMMFLQLTDDRIARRIASEMIRVTKPGGRLLLSDWRYSEPRNDEFKGVSRERIRDLYQVGKRTRVCKSFRGSLVPPIGRILSRYLPASYFVIHALFPFFTGHMVTVLKKI
jgi:SAM-dependent methyltransferase